MNKRETETEEYMLRILDKYFSRGIQKKKFIDVSRIPLICQDISNIHRDITEVKGGISDHKKDISDLKDDTKEVQDNIKWGVRLILGALIAGFVTMLFK